MGRRDFGIVVLTGAGISAESGLQTFRAADGLWCEHRVEDVATPEAFERNPELVQSFYNKRRRQLKEVQPNAAHHALARLEKEWEGAFLLVTQNVDDLHGRAGSGSHKPSALVHMHGELLKVRCLDTGTVYNHAEDLLPDTVLGDAKAGRLRPHIVWFGEMPLCMGEIDRRLSDCTLFVSIGTSGNVYPAAGFVQQAKYMAGAHTVEINLEPSLNCRAFDDSFYGHATEQVPRFVEALLKEPERFTAS